MSKANHSKPWLNRKGQPLSLDQLKERSKSWGNEIWRAYADTLISGNQDYMPDDFDAVLDSYDREESLRRYFEAERKENSKEEDMPSWFDANELARAMNDLPYLEREVLNLKFWEGKTEREIADCLEHSRGKIIQLVKSAMKTLRERKIQILKPEMTSQPADSTEKK